VHTVTDVEGAALRWLYSLADQERGVGWNPRASVESQWKLGRTRALLELSGSPDRRMRVVLVAGTKGKGSTCAMLASILDAGGYTVGLYTKPHLQSYRERVRVGGRAISPEDFAQSVDRIRTTVEELAHRHPDAGEPTTFEVTTALAVDYFARQNCQIAVVEVGLGGRLDATNALDPELSIITSISHDHTGILGRSLTAIAREKAGILRSRRPALIAHQRPTAARALRVVCRAVGAACHFVPSSNQPLALFGEHQRQNAGLAIAAACQLGAVPDTAIQEGLSRVRWPGRFEVIDGDPQLVLDGAHNDDSARALASSLEAFAAGRPIHFVIGINRDKDARAVLRRLLPLAHSVVATQVTHSLRALDAETLASVCRRLGTSAHAESSIEAALQLARRQAQDSLICVTGSLALVGQARAALGLPVPETLW